MKKLDTTTKSILTTHPVKRITSLPEPNSPGYFGAIRKFDIHTGIDLYCDNHAEVYAIENGIVVGIEKFTGEHADSPWWENTWAILIESVSGVIVYGEIVICDTIQIGDTIHAGQCLGKVIKVLKADKGKNPTAMLHLELYDHGTISTVWWKLNTPKPDNLLNPLLIPSIKIQYEEEYHD